MKNKKIDFIIIRPSPSPFNDIAGALTIPIGALCLADALIKSGFTVAIVDENNDIALSKIKDIASDWTIAFGISTMSGTQLKNAIYIARYLKVNYPNKPIIWGGAHVTAVPRQTLQSKLVDHIVYGEGELSLPKLLTNIKNNDDLSRLKGIGYKQSGKISINENMEYTPLNRETFELPYYLLEMEKYTRKLSIGLKRCFGIMSSRGCPFGCKFCINSSPTWRNKIMRYHSIPSIINDIDRLVNKYNADGITFLDDNPFVSENRLIDVCCALQKYKPRIKFRAGSRVDSLYGLKENTWKLLKDSGCVGISIGIESGSQRILDYIGKRTTLKQIYKVDELLTKYGIYKTYNFMTCLPTETIDDIKDTLRLIIQLAKTSKDSPYPFGAALHKYIPFPGTELFNIALTYGFTPPESLEEWGNFDFENVEDTINSVRPWLKGDIFNYVNRANSLIEELNNLYTGSNLNHLAISNIIDDIEMLIEKN